MDFTKLTQDQLLELAENILERINELQQDLTDPDNTTDITAELNDRIEQQESILSDLMDEVQIRKDAGELPDDIANKVFDLFLQYMFGVDTTNIPAPQPGGDEGDTEGIDIDSVFNMPPLPDISPNPAPQPQPQPTPQPAPQPQPDTTTTTQPTPDSTQPQPKGPATRIVSPNTTMDYFIFDMLNGVAFGLQNGAKVFWNGVQKFGDVIKSGLISAADAFGKFLTNQLKPLFSIETAMAAKRQANMEKFIEVQGINLLGFTEEFAEKNADAITRQIELDSQELGMSELERDNVSITMSKMITSIPQMQGMERTEFASFLSRATVAMNELTGGRGTDVTTLVDKIMTRDITNEQLNKAVDDPLMSRLVSGGFAITGNQAADVARLMTVLGELDAEIDFDEVINMNPKRILQRLQNKLFNPQEGIFGFLREFEIGGETSTILKELNNAITLVVNKFADTIKEFGNRFFQGAQMEPVEVMGRMLREFAQVLEGINPKLIADRIQEFFGLMARLFSKDNIAKISNAVEGVVKFIQGLLDILAKVGITPGKAMAFAAGNAVAGPAGGVLAMNLAPDVDPETGEVTEGDSVGISIIKTLATVFGVTIGTSIVKELTFGSLRRFFLQNTGIRPGPAGGGGGLLSGIGNLFSGIGNVLVSPFKAAGNAVRAFTMNMQLASATGAGKMGAFSHALSQLLGPFGKFAIVIGAFVGAYALTAKIMGRDLKSELEMFGDALSAARNRVKDWWENLPFNQQKAEASEVAANVPTAASQATGDALQSLGISVENGVVSSTDVVRVLGGMDAPATTTTQTNFDGQPEKVFSLVREINKAIAMEAQESTGDPILTTVNTNEAIFNQNQLASIPDLVTSGLGGVTTPSPTIALSSPAGTGQSIPNLGATNVLQPGNASPTINSNPNINVTINSQPGQSAEAIANMVIAKLDEFYSQANQQFFG